MQLHQRVGRRLLRVGFFGAAVVTLLAGRAWSEGPASGAAAPGSVAAAAEADTLPADAREMLRPYEKQEGDLRREMESRLAPIRAEVIAQLKAMQERYTKAGQLDEALAVRNRIRQLQRAGEPAVAAPATLVGLRGRAGEVLTFDLVGAAAGGSVWGSDVYTDDSSLSAAAVHAGVLRDGERGVVRVKILGPCEAYVGLIRNGVSSGNWGRWDGSFGFEK